LLLIIIRVNRFSYASIKWPQQFSTFFVADISIIILRHDQLVCYCLIVDHFVSFYFTKLDHGRCEIMFMDFGLFLTFILELPLSHGPTTTSIGKCAVRVKWASTALHEILYQWECYFHCKTLFNNMGSFVPDAAIPYNMFLIYIVFL
jgi:hypothetical protein